MTRVAIIIDSLKIGGAQRLISAYASTASAHGLQPVIITMREGGAPYLVDSIRSSGTRVITLQAPTLFSVRRLRQLITIIKDEKVDIVQTHLIYSNILGSLAAHFAGVAVIATLHSTTVRVGLKSWILKLIENYCLRRFATRILAVGRVVADFHRDSYGDRHIDVIPNGIPKPEIQEIQEIEERDRLRQEITGDGSDSIIITVGRFSRAKGYEDMIEAFNLLHQRASSPKLLMVGSGGNVNSIKAQIDSLNLTQSVILAGERDDVNQLLALSDVYASSSHREGLPLAVLEAMMVGLPVVATSVGDIPNVVTEETGVVVPPHRPELLAAALEELLKNPEKRQAMGRAAQLRAQNEYSVDAWMKRHLDLYNKVLSSNGHKNSK
jgi:glycosyltransferase involved in cell wall biosynthesis